MSGPARELAGTVVEVHPQLAEGTGVERATLDAVDRRRLEVVALFKADLGIAEAGNPSRTPPPPC
ncbi:hypothetical protein VA596_27990 [Amycolatopsis sp., V23-08]|uniref:Uncharacterized protein n=1 Tax=Amycolatopsis heterodermiae TaxID=3110235 RepID=A0ABU5RAY5_9PSEU|nr:hypothetical protein [Amycolatopsis sp., V23-08]MEA5363403.1 hypothetical protein [Amycolatopsis sp., V23-08]